jgi:hypothetical protein
MIESNGITIGWMARTPLIAFIPNSDNPDVDGWPENGEIVSWNAYIRNWDDVSKDNVDYYWSIDGMKVLEGQVTLSPLDYTILTLEWEWEFDRHEITLTVDSFTNKLTVYSDALSLVLYVEESFYDYFHEYQHELAIGSNSFEGWAQRQIAFYNQLFENAVYDVTPEGVLDRIRIDHIEVVPDGTLASEETFYVIQDNEFADLQWGFPFATIGTYSNHSSINFNNQFYYSGFIQHEIGHARYLFDIYALNIIHDGVNSIVDIKENDEPIIGSKYLPGELISYNGKPAILAYATPEQGLMTSEWTWLGRHSAAALNLIYHHRATQGNYNPPGNLGQYLYDLPAQNRLRVMNKEGEVLRKAKISIYQSAKSPLNPSGNVSYNEYFDDIPDIELVTDDNGQVLLGHNPFSANGLFYLDDDRYANFTIIIRVEYENRIGYGCVDVAQFNIEYWKGNTDLADYDICVKLMI